MITNIAFSSSTYGWDSGTSIALWTVAGVLLLVFVIQQCFAIFTTAAARLYPIHFLVARTLVLLYVATSCAATANAVTLYYIPLLFGFTRGHDALHSAARLLPFIVVFISFVLFAGATLPIFG